MFRSFFILLFFTTFFVFIKTQGKFFQDTEWTVSNYTTFTRQLGSYVYECFGNVNHCPNGFTLTFWMKTVFGDFSKNNIIITSGGHSSLSEGFYVKQNYENEFEVGVAKGTSLWSVKLVLYGHSWQHIALTWSSTNGLGVYVDGLIVGKKPIPVSRNYMQLGYYPFPFVLVGTGMDSEVGVIKTSFAMKQLEFVESELNKNDVYSNFATNINQLVFTCTNVRPTLPAVSTSTSSTTLQTCQTFCSQNSANGFLLKPSTSCQCIDGISTLGLLVKIISDNSAPNCLNTDYQVGWASHYIANYSSPLNLLVNVSPLKLTYNVSEIVVLSSTTTSNDIIIYSVDFGDGQRMETVDSTIEHSWLLSGSYIINVTAKSYFTVESVIVGLEIINNQTGPAPSNVIFKYDPDTTVTNLGKINFNLNAFSRYPKSCSVSFNDSYSSVYSENHNLLLDIQDSYIYGNVGFFNSSISCSNIYGSTNASQWVTAVNPNIISESISNDPNFLINFNISNSKNNVRMIVDNEVSDSAVKNFNSTSLVVSLNSLRYTGDHSVSLQSVSGFPIMNAIYKILNPIGVINITSKSFSAQVNETMFFALNISQGDQIFIEFSCGNNKTMLYFFPFLSVPSIIQTNCTYPNLGKYNISVFASNDISKKYLSRIISIERPLFTSSLNFKNITQLGVSAEFVINADMDKLPAIPMQVRMDYGDGTTNTVTLLPENTSSPVYRHKYVYQKYGIYTVQTTVFNNLSSIVLPPAIIQVGQNITSLDLYIADSVVLIGQNISLTLRCPTGSPVVLVLEMGDGNSLKYYRPTTYLDSDNFQAVGSNPFSNNKSGIAIISENAFYFNDFQVTYNYKSKGLFRIKATASNIFSSTSSQLCPSVTVVSPTDNNLRCTNYLVSIDNLTSASNPYPSLRSNPILLNSVPQLVCSAVIDSYKPIYVWTAEKLIENTFWKPELQVCESGTIDSKFIIPPNTLWYGTYRLNVSVIVNNIIGNRLVPTMVHSNTKVSTFVKIIPSPLIAVIKSDKSNFYSTSDLVKLNISESRDPDVSVASNRTGMKFSIFCSYSSIYANLSIADMIKRAVVVAENDQLNVSMYHFKAKPCFSTPTTIQIVDGLGILFLSKQILVSDPVTFTLFVSKYERLSNSSVSFSVLSTNLSGSPLDSIDDLLAKGDTGAALQILDLVTNGLTVTGNDSEDALNERTKTRGKIINCLNKVTDNLNDVTQLSKTAQVMSDVTANPDEVTAGAKSDAAKGLNNAAGKAIALTQTASKDQVQDITLSMLSTAGQILPFAPANDTNSTTTPEATTGTRTKRSILSKLKKKSQTDNTTSLTCCEKLNGLCNWTESLPRSDGGNESNIEVDVFDLKLTNWTDDDCLHIYPCDLMAIQKRYQQYLDAILEAQNAVKKATTTNGLGAVSTVGGILVGKQEPGETVNMNIPGMNLTVASLNDGGSGGSVGIDIPKSAGGCGAMTLDSGNPFTYGSEPTDVSGTVKTILLTSCDGQPLKVDNSTEPFVFWLDGATEEPHYLDFPYQFQPTNQPPTLNYHKIYLPYNNTAIFAMLKPIDDVIYDVYLKYDDYPNQTYYDWVGLVPNVSEVGDRRFLVHPPQEATSFNGTYRIGVTLRANDSKEDRNVTYSMYSYTASCKYWNENTSAWDTSGCSVGLGTTALKTQCKCTHLTSFGGSFAVAPNTIDFATVFTTEKFLESIPVFVTVIVMIAIYLLIIVWARHMDKADVAKWGALPLEDNLPTETYHYQMTVYTGMRKNAGTRSKPSFILSGDEADTGVRNLTDGKRKEITAGSINNYVLSVDKCLGPLTFLRIWHDNSGKGSKKGWFLDQIEFTDVQTGERFFFVCAQWMAVEEGDGQIERVVPVAGKEDMTQFGQLFSHSIRKKFSNDHLWFSVFSRPTRSSFTRVQRVSCCFSLLFMTMIVNCMFFKSTDPDHTTSVHIGPIEITLQQIFISVVSTCIILPPSLAIVTIFRKTRPKKNVVELTGKSGWKNLDRQSSLWSNSEKTRKQKLRDAMQNIATFYKKPKHKENAENSENASEVQKKKKAFMFPWWTIYIAWILVFFSIVAPGFFTILYSMQWGREKSLDWLKTFFLSFFQSVVIVQPAKVLLITAFISCILKKPDIEEEEGCDTNILKTDEELACEMPKKNIKEILKQRQQTLAAAGLLNTNKLQELREQRLKEIQIEAILKECIVYIFFILVLYFISYQDKDNRSFTYVQNLQNQFFQSGNTTFSNIQTYDDVYTWVNDTLMTQLYTQGWYNGVPTKNWQESMQTSDYTSIRLGVARLRQLRIKENTCRIEKQFQKLIRHCRSDYNWLDDDAASYETGWSAQMSKARTKIAKKYDKDKHNPWLYRDSIELKSAPYMGLINTYKGGGYVFNFYCNPQKTINKLADLQNNSWLDVKTRALFVEFTVYNANANLFGSVIMLLEFLSNGMPVPNQEVKVFRISSYVGPFGIIIILFQVIFVGFVIYFFVHTVNLMRKQKKQYFNNFWNSLEFLTVIMSIVTIAMYGMKMIFGNTAMDVMKETGAGDYVNFVTIGSWAEIYGIVLAIVVFLATLKFINMLKFNRRLSMLTETIKFSVKDMKTFLVSFFIYFLAFGQLGYLFFGSKLITYKNFPTVIETLFQFFIGSFTFDDYKTAQPIFGPIYFFLFVWAMIYGMQSMFLVIIIEAFQAVRKENQFKRNDYEVGEYLIGKVKGLFGR